LSLPDGRPIYDALGPGYTLLRRDRDVAIAALVDTMRHAGVPIEVVDVPMDETDPCDRKLILVRTDQHVVWRGDKIPDQPESLIDILRGKARSVANRPAG
jgi:hypothetical protein